MILSASRRTDIPAYFSEWFINRIKEGFFCVRNPMNQLQVSRIPINPQVVDCIVFWTKDASPLIPHLDVLADCPYYFQYTVTGYGQDVEPDVPDKKEVIIPSFRELANLIGPKRVIWRYDPIFFSDRYTPEYHLKAFRQIAESLHGYTEKCVVSLVDIYTKNAKNMTSLGVTDLPGDELRQFAGELAKIAGDNGIRVATCAEKIDLAELGIEHNCCIDKKLIEEITGVSLNVKKDGTQRGECGCVESIDIGSYNTCRHGCRYCYANFTNEAVKENIRVYDINSPILCDVITAGDKVTERNVKSLADRQMSFSFE